MVIFSWLKAQGSCLRARGLRLMCHALTVWQFKQAESLHEEMWANNKQCAQLYSIWCVTLSSKLPMPATWDLMMICKENELAWFAWRWRWGGVMGFEGMGLEWWGEWWMVMRYLLWFCWGSAVIGMLVGPSEGCLGCPGGRCIKHDPIANKPYFKTVLGGVMFL